MNFRSMEEFWPFYMSQHSKPATRRLHFVGTLFGSLCFICGLLFNFWWFLLLGPLIGYGLAWGSHFFFEGNVPESFMHPIWSLICDYKMFGLMLIGQMDREIKRLDNRTVDFLTKRDCFISSPTNMATANQVQFSLKVMMIKESNKVLYAEVDSDFADVLLSFLTLPLGTILRLLTKHYGNKAPIYGSLNSLYAGLQKLDSRHFWTEAGKRMLLNPRNSSGTECRRLKLQIDDTPHIQYFVCRNSTCVSMYYNVKCLCSNSSNTMTRKDIEVEAQSGDESVFTANTSSFLLTDDLLILTNTPTSLFRFLKLNGIQDTNVLEERSVIVGLKEIMELLKGSLVSKTPITDMVLQISSTSNKFSAPGKFEPDALPEHQTIKNVSSASRKITVKVFMQKSTNNFLFAQARNDFIDFLFSLLIIPLGSVQFLLGNSTYLGSINNLYKSISSNSEVVECMKSGEAVTRLLGPQIASFYLSCHHIFSLKQQISPIIYTDKNCGKLVAATCSPNSSYSQAKMIDPKGKNSYVKGPTTFIVTDDLAVSPPSSTSTICTLNQMKIPIHDVEEQEVEIGMQEALSILKASLMSTCALSEGLKPFLMSRRKQEKRQA